MTNRPTWIPHDLYPFDDRYVDVDGSTVHYVDEGNGPPLLLLHGNPTWSFLYRDVIKGVSNRYRCIAPDHPGFGLSRAPAGYGFTPAEHARVLERFVEQLDLNNVTMMPTPRLLGRRTRGRRHIASRECARSANAIVRIVDLGPGWWTLWRAVTRHR